MKVLKQHLWKEWREQRATVLGLLWLLPAMGALSCVFVPATRFADPLVGAACASLAGLAALLAVGLDLMGREQADARRSFLERLPEGLSAAFAAKALLFLGVLGGVVLYGALVTAGLAFLGTGSFVLSVADPVAMRYLLPLAGLALWSFSLSACMPRGFLALPAGALALAVVGWPFTLYFGGLRWYEPVAAEVALFCVLGGLGAIVCAWLSFAERGRYGARRRVSWRGLATGALILLPSWGWSAVRILEPRTVDPFRDDFRIQEARLGTGGRYAFLNTGSEEGPHRALVVDLETGDWRAVGGYDTSFAGVEAEDSEAWTNGPYDTFALDTGDAGKLRLFEGASGSEVRQTGDDDLLSAAAPAGLGSTWFEGQQQFLHDPFRGRTYRWKEVFGDDEDWWPVLIGPSGWVTWEHPREGEVPKWFLRDPDNGSRRPLVNVPDEATSGPMLPDGRVFFADDGAVFLHDPATGERQDVHIQGAEDLRGSWITNAYGSNLPAVQQPVVLWLDIEGPLAVFDEEATVLRCLPTKARRVLGVRGDRLVLLVGDSLESLDASTGEASILFPLR